MSSSGAVAATTFSSLSSPHSTLLALLADDQPPGHDTELLLPIDYAFAPMAAPASASEL
jgi:hypothetical protein